MIISRAEIANASSAYKTWEPRAFPPDRNAVSKPEMLSWARRAYETLPYQREALVRGLRAQILGGGYFVPAALIVEKMLGRFLIDRSAV